MNRQLDKKMPTWLNIFGGVIFFSSVTMGKHILTVEMKNAD
jgi:hypothetical protein